MKKVLEDNRGLSLVELIISVAMSTIILLAGGMFMYSANRSYRMASNMIDLQMEAQILMEQMGNWALESNRICTLSSNKVLVLYDVPRDNGKNPADLYPPAFLAVNTVDNSASRRVFFVEDKKLYMVKTTGIADAAEDIRKLESGAADAYTPDDIDEENCIGEFVTEFTAIVPATENADNPKSILINMTLGEGSKSYYARNYFSIRNGAYTTQESPSASPSASPEPTPTTGP